MNPLSISQECLSAAVILLFAVFLQDAQVHGIHYVVGVGRIQAQIHRTLERLTLKLYE